MAAGGRTLGTPVDDFVLGLARGRRVCVVPTANMEPDFGLVLFYDAFAGKAECSRLLFNPWPPSDLRAFTLAQDVLLVPGGNTANMLAVWRVHGFDRIVREAWEQGVVLYGWSAGMIAWFEQGVTDSFGPQLEGMDCLGFLPGSACPHYDGEGLRRPRYRELVDERLPPGLGGRRRCRAPLRRNASWPRRSRSGRRRGPTASSRARRRRSRPACSDYYERFEASQPATLMPIQIGVSSDVEEHDREPERGPPERPVPKRHRPLDAQVAGHACTSWRSRVRCSTVRITRCAVSSIESSETSITGQPRRRCTTSACASSS